LEITNVAVYYAGGGCFGGLVIFTIDKLIKSKLGLLFWLGLWIGSGIVIFGLDLLKDEITRMFGKKRMAEIEMKYFPIIFFIICLTSLVITFILSSNGTLDRYYGNTDEYLGD